MNLSAEEKAALAWMADVQEQSKAHGLVTKLNTCGVLVFALPRWSADEQLLMLPPDKAAKVANV